MNCFWTSLTDEFVVKTNVSKRSTSHHLIVTSPGTVGVEVTGSQSTHATHSVTSFEWQKLQTVEHNAMYTQSLRESDAAVNGCSFSTQSACKNKQLINYKALSFKRSHSPDHDHQHYTSTFFHSYSRLCCSSKVNVWQLLEQDFTRIGCTSCHPTINITALDPTHSAHHFNDPFPGNPG